MYIPVTTQSSPSFLSLSLSLSLSHTHTLCSFGTLQFGSFNSVIVSYFSFLFAVVSGLCAPGLGCRLPALPHCASRLAEE